MTSLPWRHIFALLLAAFFVLGGSMNIFASEQVLEDYARWGYPGWFHFLTGALEWTSAVLIAIPATRLAGSVLAAAVMASAAGTVALHGEFSHAMAPLVVLALAALNGWLTWRARRRGAATA
ncbi:DoxX family protein [Aquicoccus sp. SCR17]|nr:DoxX family protein [Carideicomes alvinocaridis]